MIFPDIFLKIVNGLKIIRTAESASIHLCGRLTSYRQDGFENEIRTYVLFLVFVS